MVSAPVTHFLWSVALGACLTRLRPDLWDSREFDEGVEVAVPTVYGLLATGQFSELRALGVLDSALLQRLEAEAAAGLVPHWEEPPRLHSTRMLGLLWARLEAGDISMLEKDPPRLRITSLVLCSEAYRHCGADAPLLVQRLQRWTFERPLTPGTQWKVLQIGPESWYWKRPEEGVE